MIRTLLLTAALALTAGPALASTYYVSTSGSDSNSGAIGTPFRTIAAGLKHLASGDTLYIRGGTYAETFWDGIASGSSWSAPTTVSAYPGESVTIQPPSGSMRVFTFTNAHYIVLNGLIMDGRNLSYEVIKITYSGSNTGDHIRIQNSELMNSPAQGILIDQTSPANELLYDKVHDNGASDFDHGIYMESSNNLIEHCEIYRNSGWGVHVYNGYVGGHASNNTIAFNRIHDNARLGNRGPGMILSSGDGNTVYNNLIWNNAGGIQVDYGATNSKIYNNTIYNNNGSSSWGIYLGNGTSANNTPASGAVVENNIIFQNNGGAIVNAEPGATVSTNLSSNPLFVNAAGLNFALSAGSPAIDAGLNLAAQGVTTDFAGVSRPQGRAYDIGAYEYAGASGGGGGTPTPTGTGGSGTAPLMTGIAATNLTNTGATIVWTTNVSADSAVDYGRSTSYGASVSNGTLTTSHSMALTGLASGTLYHYRVRSKDASGNWGPSSDETFTTSGRVTIVRAPTPTTSVVPATAGVGVAGLSPAQVSGGSLAAGCVRAAQLWENVPLPAHAAGTFTVEFEAMASAGNIDGVMGLSNGPATTYSSLAVGVRFNTAGRIDARNGGAYGAATAIAYSPAAPYHFRLVVNLATHTYSAYVRAGSGAEQTIGLNYAFRTEQAHVGALNELGLFASSGAQMVCGLSAQ